MNEWMESFISQCLADVPWGKYRWRAERELRDHMESQYRALMEAGRTADGARAEVLLTMGEPGRLRKEYRAAWERTLPGRLEAWRYRLGTWAKGSAVMLGAHILACYVRNWGMAALSIENPKGYWFWYLFPLAAALLAGADCLSRQFRTARHPVWQISVGLSFHWAFVTSLQVWWESIDNHRTFWEEFWDFMTYNIGYYSLTLGLCVLLGMVFARLAGQRSERRRELA